MATTTRELTEQELMLLGVMKRWPRDDQIGRRVLELNEAGWTETRAMQVINRLLDDPAALEHDPVEINRLRRLRASRQRSRRLR